MNVRGGIKPHESLQPNIIPHSPPMSNDVLQSCIQGKHATRKRLKSAMGVNGATTKTKIDQEVKSLVGEVYKYVSPRDIDLHLARLGEAPKSSIFKLRNKLTKGSVGFDCIDLFCGAGGLSLGFEMEGWHSKLAIDNDPMAIETYGFNRGKTATAICADIREYLELAKKIPKATLVMGGPPCQGFSNANKQRKPNDERNVLYKSFLEFASRAEAKVVLIENVPGILKYWDAIHADLFSRGFISKVYDIEAHDLGAPQKRRRVFILALSSRYAQQKDVFFSAFESVLNKAKQPNKKFVLEDAIAGLPRLKAKKEKNATHYEDEECGFSISKDSGFSNEYLKMINVGLNSEFVLNHRTKYNNERDIGLFNKLGQGEDSTSESFSAHNPYKNRDHIFKDKFFRLHARLPSKTITAHMYYDCHMYIHPLEDRGLTPREAARIQGFPDQYVFLGKPNQWYRQIGNAVSPLVSRVIGRGVYNAVETLTEI